MESSVGKILTAEEVKLLENNTKIWIETNIPNRDVFLGIKKEEGITNLEGVTKFSLKDIDSSCIVREWLYQSNKRMKYEYMVIYKLSKGTGRTLIKTDKRIDCYHDIENLDKLIADSDSSDAMVIDFKLLRALEED